MMGKILVVGSSNTDMVIKAERFPKAGETILGGNFFVFQGGKGANQAVSASRLGGSVALICKVGNDAMGKEAVKHYKTEGIDVSNISVEDSSPTGVAVITINSEGENSIIVASGANALLSVDDLKKALPVLNEAEWLLTQLETPLGVIEYLAIYARDNCKHLILNPAPAAKITDTIYERLFLITPNETEAALLTGIEITDEESIKTACSVFKLRGVQNVIITLGNKGAYVDADGFQGMVNSLKVDTVDTTAAGDVFNGAMAVALSERKGWEEAVTFACKAAAISVTQMGAQASAPYRKQVQDYQMNQP